MKNSKKLKANKLWLICLVVILLAIASAGIYVTQIRNQESNAETKNKELNHLTEGINGTIVGVTEGQKCKRDAYKDTCYSMDTVVYLVDGKSRYNFDKLLENLEKYGWNVGTDDKKVGAGEIRQQADSVINQMVNEAQRTGDVTKMVAAANLLSPTFFGEQSFLEKGQLASKITAFTYSDKNSDDDCVSIYKSEIPSSESFNFTDNILHPLKNDKSKMILAISVSK